MAIESITKLEAATRQLDLAIGLYFQDADSLGVHALAGAAHRILADLIRRAGGAPSIPHTPQDVNHVSQPDLVRGINAARNFLKHADRDHDQVLTFDPDWTGYLIFDAIEMHIRLAKSCPRSSVIFLTWLSARYPDVPLLKDVAGLGDSIDALRKLFPQLGSRASQKAVFLCALTGADAIQREWPTIATSPPGRCPT